MKTYKTPKIKTIVIKGSLLQGGSDLQNSTNPVNAEDARSKQGYGFFEDINDEGYAE